MTTSKKTPIEKRLDQLEQLLEPALATRRGEAILVKAQNAAWRAASPDGLLERAMRAISDPAALGTVTGYLSTGQVAKAAELVAAAEGHHDRAEEDEALEQVRNSADSDLTERLTAELEQTKGVVSSLLQRLARLEAAQSSPAPATVAKAAQGTARPGARKAPTAAQLLARADAVIDSPAQMGVVSSLVQDGKIAEAQRAVEAAEASHNSMVMQAQRRAARR